MNLLSSAGTRALNNFYNGVNQQGQSNLSVLQNMSVYNSYTGKNHGFNMSIFNNQSGIGSSQLQGGGSSYGTSFGTQLFNRNSYGRTGNDGLNRNGAYSTPSTTIPTSVKQYGNGQYGSSLMGNFMTSIQHVAVGQYPPTSVFEQRLNYTLNYDQQAKPGSMLGNYSNFFNTDSVANNQNSTTGYNVFGTSTASNNSFNTSAAMSSKNVSGLMSALNKTSMPYASNNQKAVANALGTKTVSGLMSVMA